MQGNYWGIHKSGGGPVATFVHARLLNSTRRVAAAADALLKFIPLHTRNLCFAGDESDSGAQLKACGVDFGASKNIPGMWRWLLGQRSFAESDGSDHFIVLDAPYGKLQSEVCRSSLCNLTCSGGMRCVIVQGLQAHKVCLRQKAVHVCPTSCKQRH